MARWRAYAQDMEWVGIVLFAVAVLAVLVLALYLFQRSLDKPGGREGLGTMGNGMGVMDNFFSPSRAGRRHVITLCTPSTRMRQPSQRPT